MGPLQRWEAEKLKSVATQVVVALESGRYTEDFGQILLEQFQSWPGADTWAGAEGSRIALLVAVAQNDPHKKNELLQWIETSLLSTLREVEKEVNRGQMEGLDVECHASVRRSGVASRQAPLATSCLTEANASTGAIPQNAASASSEKTDASESCLARSNSDSAWVFPMPEEAH